MVVEQLEDLHSVGQMLAGGDVLAAADVRRMLRETRRQCGHRMVMGQLKALLSPAVAR
jgi:stalled ribosome rescue protein Dom34